MNIVIDKEFESLLPPLSEEEFKSLEEKIVSEQIDGHIDSETYGSIIVWENDNQYDNQLILIDGHNRYKICNKNNLRFDYVPMKFESREDVKQWIIRNQLSRRNLIPAVRAELALRLKNALIAKNKEIKDENNDKTINTTEEIAKIAGVSKDTLNKVERIINSGDDVIKEKLAKGEVSVNKAFNDIREKRQHVELSQSEKIKLIFDKLLNELMFYKNKFDNEIDKYQNQLLIEFKEHELTSWIDKINDVIKTIEEETIGKEEEVA